MKRTGLKWGSEGVSLAPLLFLFNGFVSLPFANQMRAILIVPGLTEA